MENSGFRTGLIIGGLAVAVVGLAAGLLVACGGDGDTTVTTTVSTTGTGPAETSFVSPTRNIVCHVTSSEATCGILDFSFAPPPDPGNCGPERWGHTLSVNADGDASFICSNEPPAEPSRVPVLDYGQAASVGAIQCRSEMTGVTCTQQDSNLGFAVSRERYIVGDTSGPEPPMPTTTTTATTTTATTPECEPAYPDVCLPPYAGNPSAVDCADIPDKNITVLPPDPYHLDGGANEAPDGIGCEPYP